MRGKSVLQSNMKTAPYNVPGSVNKNKILS